MSKFGLICLLALLVTTSAIGQQQPSSTAAQPAPTPPKSSLTVIGAKPYIPREDQEDAAVLADEQVLIKLSGPINSLKPPVVTFGTENAAIVGGFSGKTELVVRVPANLERKEYAVKVMVNDQELSGQPILSVYPVPSATVADMPKQVEPEKPIKITGTGFLAPRNHIKLSLGRLMVQADRVAPDGTWFTARFKDSDIGTEPGGSKQVLVTVWGVPATLPSVTTMTLVRKVDNAETWRIGISAFIPFALIVGLIWFLYATAKSSRRLFAALMVEPENDTYSLSRAQFFWWLLLIAYCYLFLFFGRGLQEDTWGFPPLAGFGYTFMISLGTLVAAQATNSSKGVKGSGTKHPSPADLIVNGGVLAPERVQQVVWTVLAGLMFVWITLKTYSVSTSLPTIPDELLGLMGISSAGYIVGKMARKPGPIIRQVAVEQGSVILKIFGVNLSRSARVWIDGAEQPQDSVAVLESDPDRPNEFAKSLRVRMADSVAYEDYTSRAHDIVVFNEDSQKAEWTTTIPHISDVTIPDTNSNQVTGEITGENIVIGATARFDPDTQQYSLVQAANGHWTATVPSSVLRAANRCIVTNPTGEWASVAVQATAATPAAAVVPAVDSSTAQPAVEDANTAVPQSDVSDQTAAQ